MESKIRIFILFFLFTAAATIAAAQQKESKSPWHFHSINNIGLLEGETGSAFQLQSINGAQYKSWFGGAGIGIDYYRFRTIPLFFDLRKEFGKNSNKVFVYADLGIGFSWLTDNQKMTYQIDDRYSNGFYSDLGLGYKVAIGKNNGLLISLGYSYKKMTETYTSVYSYYPFTDFTQPDQTERINFSLNRLSIKLGWAF
jgi:hypothetical protein